MIRWWYWLAALTFTGGVLASLWVIFRALAGWPVDASWLQRLAG